MNFFGRLFVGVLFWQLSFSGHSQTLAFPGAEGFGKFSTGGRGGSVYHVTTLADSGAGSFRDAVSVANRTVVFDVGGVINYSGARYAPKSNITIAGQTAPGDGITIYGNGLSFSGANNTICRFIRVRQGINGDSGTDCIGIANGHDMIFDHMSVSWGRDETFSVSGNITNITIQSTIISQGLQTHSAGGLIQAGGGVSILRCLYIDNDTRNPKVKFKNEYVNNVVYNWDAYGYNMGGDSAGDSYVNAFNNYFINGPEGGSSAFSGGNENFHIYATNNWQDSNLNGVLDGAVIPLPSYGPMDWQATPYAFPITNAFHPLTALKLVVSDTGASWKRDVVDERMFTELLSFGTLGETVKSEFEPPMNGVGTVRNGTPYLDTDQDGMPDFWESALGMATNAANNNDAGAGGYTKLEDYLNWLAEPHGIAMTNTPVCVELRQFTRGFTNYNPVYSLANASNGTFSLVNGHIARFVPTANWNGPAGFQFTVTNSDGSALTRSMNLFFTPAAQSFTPIWRGDDLTNNWSDGGHLNWFNGQSLLFPYRNGDPVLFDGSGSASPFVNLIGTLTPSLLTFDAANNYTFSGSGSLAGAMVLNKTGTGTLTLNNTNTFTGATTVSNGTVLVNGTLLNSVVTVKSAGTLGGSGRVSVAPALQSGAKLAPGGVGGAGTLTFSNGLTLPHAITLRFDLSDDPTGLTKTNDQIIVNGALTATGTNYVRVTLPDGPLNNGLYPLIKYTSFSGGLTNFVLINANGVLTNPPGQIAILVNNVRYPAALKWTGNGVNNNWDNAATTNWLNGIAPSAFYFFDSPLFDDSGSTNPAVNLIGALTPQSATFNATKNYTLAGSGKISGYGPLIKTNSGTLTILTANDYAGQTVIGGGVLSIPTLPNATVAGPVGIVEEDIDNLFFTGGTLRYTGGSTSTDRKLTLGDQGGTLEITNSGAVLTLNSSIAGGGILIKTGGGQVDCATASSFTGGMEIRAGTMRLVSGSGFGSGAVTLNGTTNSATFRFGSDGQTINNQLTITGTNNFILLAGNDTVMNMIGDGTVHITTNSGTTFTMAGNMNGFSGIIRATAIANVRFNGSVGSGNALFDMGNNTVLLNNRNGGSTYYLGALSGGANVTLQGASSANSLSTYVIGGRDADTTFAGKITEVIPARTAAIVKVGTGTLTLTHGSSTYTGGTTVNEGTLLVNNSSGNGTGTNYVVVNDTGTLGGTGFIFGPVTNYTGGTIAPGNSGVGTLTLKSNLFLNAGSYLNFQLGTTSDKLVVSNNLVLNGIINVTNAAGFGPGYYTNILCFGAMSGVMPVIGSKPAGYFITVSTNTAKQLYLLVQAQTVPTFSNFRVTTTNLIFSGTGGPTNAPYYVLTSTNLTTPRANWARLTTNLFSATGGFGWTNTVNAHSPQSFYLLAQP